MKNEATSNEANVRAFGRMYADERKAALGLSPTAHLPWGDVGPVFVHGIKLWLVGPLHAMQRGQSRNKPQRVLAKCPECGKVCSAGNLAQHFNVHTEGGRAMLARKEARRLERRNRYR